MKKTEDPKICIDFINLVLKDLKPLIIKLEKLKQ